MKILHWIWVYLKDWKNLLTHSIVGVSIFLIAVYLPVKPIYRIGFLVIVVIFNIIRMKLAKRKNTTGVSSKK
jgi:hypothetical protein